MIGEQIGRVACHPKAKVDSLIVSCIQTDQHPASLAAEVCDGMAIALRDVRDVPFGQRFNSIAAVRAEQTDAELTIDDVLPLVRIGMPMQLAQAARLEVENN